MPVEITEDVSAVLEVDEENVVVVTETITTVVEVGIEGPQGIQGVEGPPGPTGVILHREVPSDPVNGVNRRFLATVAFVPGSTIVFLNGLAQTVPDDYVEVTDTRKISFVTAPIPGDSILMIYTEA